MISVIIPTYQSPSSLDLCLRSLIEGQTKENEIIVVVDGFYDLNKEILQKHKKYIKILDLPQNQGLCRATNLGVYNASNKNILIINDDNVACQNWDFNLNSLDTTYKVYSPNQIEPIPSMFKQFIIKNLGRDPQTFDLQKFWDFVNSIKEDKQTQEGSTLPIYMSKLNYLAIGGWDENYGSKGLVADWDFFLKCDLMGLEMIRLYNTYFYHFVSLTTKANEKSIKERQKSEMQGHEYARYKWGNYIKHSPEDNLKYL